MALLEYSSLQHHTTSLHSVLTFTAEAKGTHTTMATVAKEDKTLEVLATMLWLSCCQLYSLCALRTLTHPCLKVSKQTNQTNRQLLNQTTYIVFPHIVSAETILF